MEDFARGTNIEITQHPNQDPTEEDYNSAYAFYDETYDSMVQNDLLTVESAEEEGYVKWDNIHWIHPDRLLEEGTLNTNKPESLVFQDGELVGVMYLQNKLTDRGEQFAGPLTMWHYHPLPLAEEPVCMGEQITQQSSADVHYPCREGAERRKRSPEMIHVWLKKHPKGQYATRMRNLPDEFQEREPFKMSEEEFREHTEETYYSYHISEDAV